MSDHTTTGRASSRHHLAEMRYRLTLSTSLMRAHTATDDMTLCISRALPRPLLLRAYHVTAQQLQSPMTTPTIAAILRYSRHAMPFVPPAAANIASRRLTSKRRLYASA